MKAFLDSCDDHVSADDFASCATYWIGSSRRTQAPSTVKRRLSSMRAFARWAGLDNDLDDYKAPKPLKANPHPLPEGTAGVMRMIEATDVLDHKALIALCGLCGLRISEARSVTPDSIDIHALTLRVVGKGDKERTVPISDTAWSVLVFAYYSSISNGGRAFVRVGDRSARRTVTNVGRNAGLSRRVASHDLRATFATALMNKGVNIRIIQELLGHSSVATTETYLGVNARSIREAVNL